MQNIEQVDKYRFSNKELEILQKLNFEQTSNKTLNLKK